MPERFRLMHDSLRTKVYAYRIKSFIRSHDPRLPPEFGVPDARAFLTKLADPRSVALSMIT